MSHTRYYFKELRFRQLRALVELGKKGSFSEVARSQELSVPSVWQQIRAMENEFSVALVQTVGQKATLTEEGKLLAGLGAPLVEDFDRLREIFADRVKKLPRSLVIASTPSLFINELHQPLKNYQRSNPNVSITLLNSNSLDAITKLKNNEADFAVAGQLNPNVNNKLTSTPFTNYRFNLVCSNEHAILKYKRLRLAHLIKYPMLLMESGSVSRARVEQVFEKHDLLGKFNILMEACAFKLFAKYVRSGFGISIVSLSPNLIKAAQRGDPTYKGLVFRDVSQWFADEQVAILQRKHRIELPHHTSFRELFSE